MSRVRTTAIAALALALGGALLLPSDDEPAPSDGTITPSGDVVRVAAETAGPGALTPQMRAEIDRVVAAGPRTTSTARLQPQALVDRLVRCASFEEQTYCLYAGWTDRSPDAVRDGLAAAAASTPETETTGGLDAAALLRRAAALSPGQRAAAERAELVEAARSVAKVVLLRHHVADEPLPDGFLERHPEARATTASAATARSTTKSFGDYPQRGTVLKPRRVREQSRTYWCGPATMQMIAWGWQDRVRRQGHWADRLGTTTDGTAITEMVRVTNRATGYDNDNRAGRYIVLDIADWSYKQWMLLQMRHIVDYRAPLILHPILLERYYPYLDDDASGHFQVGRGYDKNGDKPANVGYFEPWNQQRFDPSEPYIARVQWRRAYKSFRANKAHFQHNIGV